MKTKIMILVGTMAVWLQAGCFGGFVVDGNSNTGLNGATVTVTTCPSCASHAKVTPIDPDYDGSWKFDAYEGDKAILVGAGADAVRVRVEKTGYITRTFYHQVQYKTRTTPDGDRYYDITENLRLFPVGSADSDGDGLYDIEEAALGTNQWLSDTDNDGIPDGWEVWGYNWVDYKRLGCDPLRKDLLVDVDYQHYKIGDVTTSAKLSDAVVAKAKELYGSLNISNPDGSTGVNLILVQDDKLPQSFNCSTSYADDSQNGFDPIHRETFRHAALCEGTHSGRAQIAGQRFFVQEEQINADISDDQTEEEQFWWYSTFVHELGHNLGLRHGGHENLNRKPNYPSLMNYAYDVSFNGSPLTLQDTLIQFSPGILPDLDEPELSEKNSFPGFSAADIAFLGHYDDPWRGMAFDVSGVWVNWNRNSLDGIPNYEDGWLSPTDINQDSDSTRLLADFDDHAAIETNLSITLPASGTEADDRPPVIESILDQDNAPRFRKK